MKCGGKFMETKLMTITPSMAMEWLENNIETNRTVRDSVVSKYARDMRNGNWKITHQGIAFNSDGKLIDGQHRLWAIVESNTPVEMYVSTGLDKDTEKLVDGGLVRTMIDRMKFINDDLIYRQTIIHSTVRILHLIKLGYPDRYKFSVDEMESFITKYYTILKWIYSECNECRNIRNAGIQVSIISALCNGYEPEDLMNFALCVSKGEIAQGEYNHTAAIKFRNWLDSERRKTGIDMSKIVINKCENAIYNYVKNKSHNSRKKIVFDVSNQKLDDLEEKLKNKEN